MSLHERGWAPMPKLNVSRRPTPVFPRHGRFRWPICNCDGRLDWSHQSNLASVTVGNRVKHDPTTTTYSYGPTTKKYEPHPSAALQGVQQCHTHTEPHVSLMCPGHTRTLTGDSSGIKRDLHHPVPLEICPRSVTTSG